MEDQKRDHGSGWRRAMALSTGAALTFGCSHGSNLVDPETTGAISAVSQPASKTSIPKFECPGMDIRPGASTLNIAVKPNNQATAGDLRYQLSIGQNARECRVRGGIMSIKVGVQGRILVGPFGTPGSVDVPLRYAVVREGPEPKLIVTKFKQIRATIAPGKTHVQFLDIESGLTFPLPSSAELAAYVVYVGFDEIGDKTDEKQTRTSKKQAARYKQNVTWPLNAPHRTAECCPAVAVLGARGAVSHLALIGLRPPVGSLHREAGLLASTTWRSAP